MTSTSISSTPMSAAEQRIVFADAALGVAGHQVTDPAVRDLMGRVARNEITGDQAVEALRYHVQS